MLIRSTYSFSSIRPVSYGNMINNVYYDNNVSKSVKFQHFLITLWIGLLLDQDFSTRTKASLKIKIKPYLRHNICLLEAKIKEGGSSTYAGTTLKMAGNCPSYLIDTHALSNASHIWRLVNPACKLFKAQQFSSLPLFNLSSWSPNSINWPLLTIYEIIFSAVLI